MKLYKYVITRDFGFAPNPYFGYCTLATCKPVIRRCAQKGDWIAAVGSARSKYRDKLVYIMKVDECMTFNEYWGDARFLKKKPIFNKGAMYMYGDNIYHEDAGKWIQELSHHSRADGGYNYDNLERDTNTNRVLISTDFFYFGNNAIEIPKEYGDIIHRGRNHGVVDNKEIIEGFWEYIRRNYNEGINGVPFSRITGRFANYGGK